MRFTVVTATRNRPDWIAGCAASVQAQTFKDFEHVIYDIGDTPIQELLPDDPRIRYIRGEKAQGMAIDWNVAFSHARGDILTSLSDDDRLPAHALETASREIGEHEWLVGATVLVNTDGFPVHYRGGTPESLEQTLSGQYMLGGAIYFRPSLLARAGDLDNTYEGAADVDLYVRFARVATPRIINEVMHIYTDHPNTDSRVRADHQAAQTRRVYENTLKGAA